MASTIRLATAEDAEQILAIYAPIVRETSISFEFEPPSLDEMRRRIARTLELLPWLVCEREGSMLGYVYAGKHRERMAYQWSVDVSVYVDTRAHRSGVGRALYTSLFAVLALQGFYNAYAGATLPNPASVGLHESLGFQRIGVYRSVGYKMGAWHDVVWWHLPLKELVPDPAPPSGITAVQGSAASEAALATGLPLLRI